MIEKLKQIQDEIERKILEKAEDAEQFRLTYLSRKGKLNDLFEEFKAIPNDLKKETGKLMNQVKQLAQDKFNAAKEKFEDTSTITSNKYDLSLPAYPFIAGARHPLLLVEKKIVEIFNKLGFSLAYGPEIEDDWHNFSGLNFPDNHPARDMQDTFFIEKDIALRTHTSSVQVRLMENKKPPIRAIMPGRVYRNEAISARAHCFFHQIEGIYIDKKVSFADLKQTLYYFVQEMFGNDFKIRFRPSYFPFTEPSAEMDISCIICKGKGCNVCKHSGWVEILGCGMIDPNVLQDNGINPEEYSGFAFGMGIERITMLKYDVKDLRMFSINDVRFLQQFESE
ncbi:MAG: phenylalanine--tRNA ligase subunit alpha [Bacteroidia bacterium]|nr:phenylalanine--tRNA ligase subunit alpha [Bacteroidia bacterium]